MASCLHSRPSPQGRSFLRPQGSPSLGEHTRQQLHLSGTYPPGHLGLGHELTSHREAHLSERKVSERSCVKRNKATDKNNCIVTNTDNPDNLYLHKIITNYYTINCIRVDRSRVSGDYWKMFQDRFPKLCLDLTKAWPVILVRIFSQRCGFS